MPDFLLFQLYGPLASWGDIAVGGERPSFGHPTKSALNGLLGAALGIERQNDAMHEQIARCYGVAVCVRVAGESFSDYHTAQVPGGRKSYATRKDQLNVGALNTILSKRDYYMDAFSLVAIWRSEDEAPFRLIELSGRLKQPRFHLYLGRKSCPPSLPLNPLIMSDTSLKQAFADYPLDKTERWLGEQSDSSLHSYYWESGGLTDTELGDMKPTMTYSRHDQVSSRSRWQFANREEHYYAEITEEG